MAQSSRNKRRSGMTLTLETSRLRLMPVVQDDWRDYFPILADPQTSRRSNLPRKPTEKRTQGVVRWMVRLGKAGKGFGWMIRESETGLLAGCIRINSIDKPQSVGIIGYEIAPAMWGKGYATEALNAVVEHAHDAMRIHRLEAWTLDGNPQSDRVLLKSGFRREGTQRSKMRLGRERFDMHLFGRLADDTSAAATS
jgi:[ribosomal protein S5]-alanine N-acetyltransferase